MNRRELLKSAGNVLAILGLLKAMPELPKDVPATDGFGWSEERNGRFVQSVVDNLARKTGVGFSARSGDKPYSSRRSASDMIQVKV